jgi:hypothetical protein
MPKLKIATCQFPVSADPARNARRIKRLISAAAGKGAQVAHFPENALSGFGGKSGPTLHSAITKPTLQAHAACNHVWISASNASSPYQSWSSCVVQPDGRIRESLRRHRTGMLFHVIDTEESFEDKCGSRNRAMAGILRSGETVKDKRSEKRDCL